MAAKNYEMGLVLVLALMICRGAVAQSGCSSTIMSLSSCINYVTGNSSAPSPSCCSSLGSVVQSQPQCLCPLLASGTGSVLGIAINQTLALSLPAVCNVQTPPLSRCNAANGPAGATAPAPAPTTLTSPTDASNETPDETPSTTKNDPSSIPSGSKTVPATGGSTSDGSTMTSTVNFAVVTLLAFSWIANTFIF